MSVSCEAAGGEVTGAAAAASEAGTDATKLRSGPCASYKSLLPFQVFEGLAKKYEAVKDEKELEAVKIELTEQTKVMKEITASVKKQVSDVYAAKAGDVRKALKEASKMHDDKASGAGIKKTAAITVTPGLFTYAPDENTTIRTLSEGELASTEGISFVEPFLVKSCVNLAAKVHTSNKVCPCPWEGCMHVCLIVSS